MVPGAGARAHDARDHDPGPRRLLRREVQEEKCFRHPRARRRHRFARGPPEAFSVLYIGAKLGEQLSNSAHLQAFFEV